MRPSTLRDIAISAMEKLHLGSKKSKKVASLDISSPIEGTFQHHEHILPGYHADIEHADPVVPHHYSDLVIFTEQVHRQLVGTELALATEKESINHYNRMLQLQLERSAAVETNNKVLREEIVELKKQIAEEKEIADKLRRSGGKSRNALKTEVSLLALEKTYLEGVVREMLEDVVERDARLEHLALSMLEILGEVGGAQ